MFTPPIPANEEARLEALRRYGILDTPPEQGYDDIAALACFICEAPFALITLVDRDRQWFKSNIGFGAGETQRKDSFCACTLSEAATLVVEDAREDPRFAGNPFVLGEPGIRFYAGAPLVAPGGYVLGTVCVFDTRPRTLTSRQLSALEALARQVVVQLELRLQIMENERAAERLRTVEKLAAVGRLASSIAHEINNPLQSVSNLLFMAAGGGESTALWMEQAQDELRRVAHIVTGTLRFHRQSETAREVYLLELVDSVLLLFRTRFLHASVTASVRDRQSTPLRCLSLDLRQVIANLVSNSLDALASIGGGPLLFRISSTHHPADGTPGVRLNVADAGSGMDEATLARMFEPFFTTKSIRGTGLGLWVSKGILEKHQGRIRVRTAQGLKHHGTVISIFLPANVSLPATLPATSTLPGISAVSDTPTLSASRSLIEPASPARHLPQPACLPAALDALASPETLRS